MRSLLHNRTFWMLMLICAVTLLPVLGLSDYHTKGEPRESIVSYTMLADGNWILPRNSYGEIAYKPPFFHWCIAAVSAVWGGVTEATSRLPSALALILMTLASFTFYARRKGDTIGFVAALVAYTAFELHRQGANCRVDMVLTALITGALYSLYRWYERGMKGIPWAAILMMGLGTMTKGPVGSVLPCLSMGVFLLLRGKNFFKVFLSLFVFGLLSLLLYAVWFYAAWLHAGDDFINLVYEENIGRMTGTMSYKVHDLPWTFNIVSVVAGYVPWTLLFLISLFFIGYGRLFGRLSAWWTSAAGCRLGAFWQGLRRTIAAADDTALFSLTCAVVIFVFYCIPESKRSVYLMPVFPFLGYFMAVYLMRAATAVPRVLRIYGGILSVLTSLLFLVFVAVKLGLVPDSIFGNGRHAAQNVEMLRALEGISHPVSLLLVMVPTVVGICWWCWRCAVGRKLVYSLIAVVLSIYVALDFVYTPTVLNCKSVKAVAAAIDSIAPASKGPLYEYMEASMEVKGDPLHFFEINFYLDNRIGSFYYEKPESGYLLIPKADAELRFADFERQGYRFELCYKAPKRDIELYRFTKEAHSGRPQGEGK